ncbi:dUTP diphosphatase [Sharpea azabuensis]|uniref:dUTP diphosphatase n=1 Tax=Sharpea azabuensis TaxID=322505 RepID=A0A1H6Y210_9FIRM|nr:dUTP diphosphatase [Sharpea azabuensis]HBZ89239.1 deoxyuridine 5'-triphosphate nucleotidohydrolase [Erysipelotrichaceae bacterium]MDD6513010.1 dUTP diphosphatase [Sharpea azabuensis]MEE3309170.1 dUTP diphosphatase [Sharpea azabuensis]SEJ31132.1 deoxyuridine 5'-triphosphate nucleotidohydrolase [Sharpea azabuensis]SFE08118.1 deoxyuridine 5'-triphosphate nucleotidohydrolase [Sharpea azabuensis]
MSTLFHKVSLNQFALAYKDNNVENIYNDIKLPQRATKGSAGYDFFAPFDFTLKPNETITIPTGIRCEMDENRVLMIFPRSGLGFKYRMQLNNTVGIIDSDYFYSDNEGHIFIKITNNTNEDKVIEVKKGQGFAQGLFMQYFLTDDDDASAIRNGGFGSTTK